MKEIDDIIDQWHNSDTTHSLVEFLGISNEEYAKWVMNPKHNLEK